MTLPYELLIALRYTRLRGKRNAFIGFISLVSMLGIALGVAALIVVLSVMNGFQKEVRDRMLSVIAHAEVYAADGGLQRVEELRGRVLATPGVLAAAPFVGAQALITRQEAVRGLLVRGVDPALEVSVSDVANQLRRGSLDALKSGEFGIVLGSDLARHLGAQLGEKVTLLAPSNNAGLGGAQPRMRAMTVVGIFESGHRDYDEGLALLHWEDAAKIFSVKDTAGNPAPSGLRLKLRDMMQAPELSQQLAKGLGQGWLVRDWTRENRVWFEAVRLEKRMMWIILTLIVAVAAFNLVSSLVMTVTDKRSDIAILRTLGASPSSIMAIFMAQGALVGVIGTALGVGLGCLVAFNVTEIVSALESLLRTAFLPKSLYLISRMPSDPRFADIWPISVVALALAFIATLYPSWRAARVNPAEALRYE